MKPLIFGLLLFATFACGRHNLTETAQCTGSSPEFELIYVYRVFDDGRDESICTAKNLASNETFVSRLFYFDSREAAQSRQYECSTFLGENTVSSPYWAFRLLTEDAAQATLSTGGLVNLICIKPRR